MFKIFSKKFDKTSDDFENTEYNLQVDARMMKFGKHERLKIFWTVRSPYGFKSRFSHLYVATW